MSRSAEATGDTVRFYYVAELTRAGEDSPGQGGNVRLLSLVGSSPSDRTSRSVTRRGIPSCGGGSAQARACGGAGLCRDSLSSLPSPTSDNRVSGEDLGLSGFAGREAGKDALLTPRLTRKQTELKAVRRQAVCAQTRAHSTTRIPGGPPAGLADGRLLHQNVW